MWGLWTRKCGEFGAFFAPHDISALRSSMPPSNSPGPAGPSGLDRLTRALRAPVSFHTRSKNVHLALGNVVIKETEKMRAQTAGKARDLGGSPQVRNALTGVVKAAEFSELVGLTDERLRQLAAEGMPKASRGKYPLRDALRFMFDKLRSRHWDRDCAGPTRADLEREILALKLKRAKGEVFDRKEVLDTWEAGYVRLGAAHENLATRIGRELNLTGDDVKIIRDMTDEMRHAFVEDCQLFAREL